MLRVALPNLLLHPCSESGYTHQRKFAAWTGGSIFASLESFKQLLVTKQEWEESADAALLTKCF